MPEVEVSTPANTPEPIGPYNHVARVGDFITVGGVAGVDPATGQLAGATSSRKLARSSTDRVGRASPRAASSRRDTDTHSRRVQHLRA